MSNYFSLNYEHTGIDLKEILKHQDKVNECASMLKNGTGLGNEFLGWLNLPTDYDKAEFKRVKECAKRIRNNSQVVVNVGIGGSYLGLRMALEFLRKEYQSDVEMLYAGNSISGSYLNSLVKYLEDKDFSIIMVSKSGTTTEPAIAFRVLEDLLAKKYDNYQDRIYCVTDKARGALKTIATDKGYEAFVIPDNVGGRYSVLTPVGLLGMAACGVDIDKVMEGAKEAQKELENTDLKTNEAYQYAVIRNILSKDVPIELMVSYEPSLLYFNEWWKQLYGESEGKDGKGLFPASVSFSTDLHSMGQYIQQGQRVFFETIINVKKPKADIIIKERDNNLDNLNYLAGKTMSYVNEKAYLGTLDAHVSGGVKCMVLDIPDMEEKTLGYMIYFFEKACGLSGYLLGVNPFNQPGVELYKSNMFKLLGKPEK